MSLSDDPSLVALVQIRGGYFTTADAKDLGHHGTELARAAAAGEITRVRHGTWAPSRSYDALSAEDKYALRARAVAAKLGPGTVLSHQSAAAVRRLPLVDADLRDVHVTRLDGRSGRKVAGIHFHEGRLTEDEVEEVDGALVTAVDRTVWETSSIIPARGGVVLTDAALHEQLTTLEILRDLQARNSDFTGAPRVATVLDFADARAESVGESVSRWAFHVFRLPPPDLQVDIIGADGTFKGRTDFGWEKWRHLCEFDGLRKYLRPFRDGDDASAVVVAEKLREEAICAERYGMSRVIWDGVYRLDHRVGIEIGRQMESSRQRFC